MNGIGLDCGNATLKLVLLSPEGKFLWEKTAFHYGAVVQSARRLLGALLAADPAKSPMIRSMAATTLRTFQTIFSNIIAPKMPNERIKRARIPKRTHP